MNYHGLKVTEIFITMKILRKENFPPISRMTIEFIETISKFYIRSFQDEK